MITTERKEQFSKLAKTLFFLLLFLLPLNLGKHFEIRDAYVWGILVDYLIPTIYLQDILALGVLVSWILSGDFKKIAWKETLNRKEVQFATLFVFSTIFSVLSAQRFVPAVYFWLRLVLYFSIFLYVLSEIKVEDYFFKVLDIVILSTGLVSTIGILQFLNKGSIFNNYLILGEQPYSASTWGIAKEYFLGHLVVPAYGLFRHPNIFGGFLSISLVWILAFIKRSKKYLIAFILGVFALVFTFSFSAWLVFIFGIILHYLFSFHPQYVYTKKVKVTVLVGLFTLGMLVLPLLPGISTSPDPSLYRRSNLLLSSYRVFSKYPLFGVGLNNLTVLIDNYMPALRDIRFTQPVHNVYALILAEAGIFSFGLYIIFLFFVSKKLINSSYFHILLISFLQIVVLSSLDHYFFTIQQTALFFWIIVGLAIQ